MKIESVVELYRDNDVGLSSEQITYIYENAYTYFKKRQQSALWEQFRPQMGWFVAIILFVLLVLRDVIKKWLSSFFEMIGNWFYNRLAGSRLLRGIALRRYRKALMDKYEKLRIPFRPQDSPLMMHDVYIPLRVSGLSALEQIEAYKAISEYQKFMVVGAPGSGKSMFCKNIAFAYSEGRLNLPNYSIPVLLELHRLNNSQLSIEQHLVAGFARNNFPHAEQFVARSLKQGILMLVLDGLDEVSSSERRQVVQAIKDLLDEYRKCRVLITCRTAVYRKEFSDIVDQTLEIVEFSDQQIRRFLHSWEPDMPEDKSIKQLMRTLRDRPRIMSLARNPLLLTIIAYLYTDTPIVLPHSRSGFYEESIDVLLRHWHSERNRFETRDKRAILQHLALFNQDVAIQRQGDRRSIEYETTVEQVRTVLPRINLRNEQVDDVLEEIVERSGLMLSIDGGERYQFVHLTLQEFLAAEELRDDAEGLLERFLNDPDTWRETVKLWCGLASDSTILVQKIYKTDPITAFECLADAKKIEPRVADRILNNFKTRLDANDDEIDIIVKAFGVVASDLRPRGQAVFEFLEHTLQNSKRQEQFLAAAIALSYTNLPQAANILIKYYTSQPEIREALLRMGDIAVTELLFLAKKGFIEAIDGLFVIGTPEAAEALVPLLWDETRISCYAAWRLAALLPQSQIESVLRNYSLTVEYQKSDWIKWIWRPFSEPENSALPIIAGRIAYLIEHAHIENAPKEKQHIDPRLSIPLYSVGVKGNMLKKYLLETMPSQQKTTLLQRLSGIRRAISPNDWFNISRPAKHRSSTSFYNITVLILAMLISVLAISQMGSSFLNPKVLSNPMKVSVSISVFLVLWGWIVLWRKFHWEFDTFTLFVIKWPVILVITLFIAIPVIITKSFLAFLLLTLPLILILLFIIGVIYFISDIVVKIGLISLSIYFGAILMMPYYLRLFEEDKIDFNMPFDLDNVPNEEFKKEKFGKSVYILSIGSFSSVGYFATSALLTQFSGLQITLGWICLIGICAILLWLGRRRYNAAQSPLRGLVEL